MELVVRKNSQKTSPKLIFEIICIVFFGIVQNNSKQKRDQKYWNQFYSNRIQNYSKNIQMMCRCFFCVPHGRQENLRMTVDWICTRSRTDETVSVSMAFNFEVHTRKKNLNRQNKVCLSVCMCTVRLRVYVCVCAAVRLSLSFCHLHSHSHTFSSHMLRVY